MIVRNFKVIALNVIPSKAYLALFTVTDKFVCKMTIQYHDEIADVRSIPSLMSLILKNDDNFSIICDGEDEVEAMDALSSILTTKELVNIF